MCGFEVQVLEQLVFQEPAFGRTLLGELSSHLERSVRRVGLLSGSRLEPKLATLILDLGRPTGDEDRVVLGGLTRKDLAQMCGASTEALVRCLAKMKAEEVVRVERDRIEVLNQPHLLELCRRA